MLKFEKEKQLFRGTAENSTAIINKTSWSSFTVEGDHLLAIKQLAPEAANKSFWLHGAFSARNKRHPPFFFLLSLCKDFLKNTLFNNFFLKSELQYPINTDVTIPLLQDLKQQKAGRFWCGSWGFPRPFLPTFLLSSVPGEVKPCRVPVKNRILDF